MLNDKMISHQTATPCVWACVRISEGKSLDTSMCICFRGGALKHAVCRLSFKTERGVAAVVLHWQSGNTAVTVTYTIPTSG